MRRYEEDWTGTWRSGDVSFLMQRFGITNICARILWSRGYRTEEEVGAYLYGSEEDRWPRLTGTDDFVRVMREAIAEGGKFRVIGDYDVDGVTATYLMVTALRMLGAEVDYRIPDRVADGYGISEEMVRQALSENVRTIVTVDNGIAAVKQCALAKELGLRIVVTDHHDPQETLPLTDCTVDPKTEQGVYRYENLCGAVVAGLLADALLASEGMTGYCERMIEILAIATICDVMDMNGYARDIIQKGLLKPVERWNAGLRALFIANGLTEPASAYHFGFVLGPCINALGRLDTADYGVELLLTADESLRQEYASRMVEVNLRRREQSDFYAKEALRIVDERIAENPDETVIVLHLPGCHESIAGIVCGKIREAWNRPTFLLTDAAGESNLLKGSGRSTETFSMIDAMKRHSDLFVKYGGHPMAAGLSIEHAKLDEFRAAMAVEFKAQGASLRRERKIDLEVPFSELSTTLVEELELLGPFGKGNRQPCFALRNAEIVSAGRVGTSGKVLALQLRDASGTTVRGVSFDLTDDFMADLEQAYGKGAALTIGRGKRMTVTILYSPKINTYNGRSSVEIRLEGYRFP